MLPIVGIDLGTTFSAIAYVDALGQPQVIANSSGSPVTPSIVCFNGRDAWIGEKASARKLTTPNDIYEFVKRDIGKPVNSTRALYDDQPSEGRDVAPYEIGGYKYGAAGLSAIILRYLKKQALRHFRKLDLTSETDDTKVALPAVITVPAYFGEKERRETRLAGYAAGFDVVGILNEPTAAALAFGLMRREDQVILVFDLGGGTFDVTVLQMAGGDATVLATRGDNALGGRDFDELLQRYLLAEAKRRTGVDVDESAGFEIQRLATEAKHALSDHESFTATFTHAGQDIDVILHRTPPPDQDYDEDLLDSGGTDAFYFEERSASLLHHCRALCESVLEGVTIEAISGARPARWSDIGEIVLAGGSCKMPMVGDMLERLTGRRIRRHIEGFSYDTAIAVGAALYGTHRERVRDVLSHGLGVKLIRNGREYVDFVMKKDSTIPQTVERSYRAAERAILEVWEGESEEPDECIRRGSLELDNPEGQVTIAMEVDGDGCLKVSASYPPVGRKEMEIRNDLFDFRGRATDLHRRIQNLTINV